MSKRITFQHYNGPVTEIYDETSSIREGNAVKTMVELATELLGGAAPADTDAAIEALVDAGYVIKIAPEQYAVT